MLAGFDVGSLEPEGKDADRYTTRTTLLLETFVI